MQEINLRATSAISLELIEIGTMTRLGWTEGCLLNLITTTETAKKYQLEVVRFTQESVRSRETSNRLRSHGTLEKKQIKGRGMIGPGV
jgi:hypothetical protein